MKPKLLIINNGLKDLRGHYFETSISIAEASHQLGYRPILATHATCEAGIIPEWVEFYPIFCTDHWMLHPPEPAPDLNAIRGDAAALFAVNIDKVLSGESTLHDYLMSRFEDKTFPELELPTPHAAVSHHGLRGLFRRAKRVLREFIPPFLLPGLRRLYRHGRTLPSRLKAAARIGMPPLLQRPLRVLYRALRGKTAGHGDLPLIAENVLEQVDETATSSDPLEISLANIEAEKEFDYTLVFQRDMERLLCLTGATKHDHVFLPTAHGRELIAVQRVVEAIGACNAPVFHLEFRHALDMSGCFEDPNFIHPYVTQHQVFFDHSRRVAPNSGIRLYTDTKELTGEYEHFSGLDFGVLPIPFRANLIRPTSVRGKDGLCIAYFGDVRDEKGFFHIPAIVADLLAGYVEPGKVRFLVQGSLSHPEWNAKSAAALEKLKTYPANQVRIVGLDAPLAPEEYFQLVSEADLLLCPYSPHAYKRRSSGTLTEAIAAGIPTVVPQGTWLATQQPDGTGEQFHDEPSLAAAVRKICDNYDRYLNCARRAKEEWLAFHSPAELVKRLVEPSADTASITTHCKVA